MGRDTSRNFEMIERLRKAGISVDDAFALRRISMTLHRWHELECGDGNNFASWCITRGHKKNGEPFTYDDDGKPYTETHYHDRNGATYSPIPDRERGALKRLAAIMARYPELKSYIQGDPRGASLYIIRPDDVPAGEDVGAYYNRGVAVYK